jgi:O-antigen/teichoic acid export membrane protein
VTNSGAAFSKKMVFSASSWVLGAYGVAQLIRLGSNLVVTRLLVPEMFGLMAVVQVVMYGLYMCTDAGLGTFVIRHKGDLSKSMLNTIWSMQVLRGCLVFGLICCFSGFLWLNNNNELFQLTGVYSHVDLPLLLLIVGFTTVIRGFNSLAPHMLTRQLKRGKIEIIELSSQVLATTVMIGLAWYYHSVWALASSGIVAALSWLIISDRVFKVRHSFEWNKQVASEVYIFGRWIFLSSIIGYLASEGDKLIFAAYMSATLLGVYSIAFMLSSVVSNTWNHLISRVLFPILTNVANHDFLNLKNTFYSIRLKQDIFLFFSVGVLFVIAPRLVEFLYDERFHAAGWMMQILVFSLVGTSLSSLGLECLTALGKTKIRMRVVAIRSVFIIIILPILFAKYGLKTAIAGVVVSNFVSLPVLYYEMYKQNLFSFMMELRALPIIYIGYFLATKFMLVIGF